MNEFILIKNKKMANNFPEKYTNNLLIYFLFILKLLNSKPLINLNLYTIII